jgi:rubrerythrin
MGALLNADEVLDIAERIEVNGANFYRRAARKTTRPDTAQLLIDLAAMEDKHKRIFAEMRKKLSEKERAEAVFDPYDEAVAYLQTFADGHVFEIDKTDYLGGKETIEDIIRMAIGMEKDAIVFYLGTKDVVPENLGKSRIDDIIKEEMSHITQLNRQLALSEKQLKQDENL